MTDHHEAKNLRQDKWLNAGAAVRALSYAQWCYYCGCNLLFRSPSFFRQNGLGSYIAQQGRAEQGIFASSLEKGPVEPPFRPIMP